MARRLLRHVGPWHVIGAACLLGGAWAAWLRFTQGLGAATNLSDDFPWGLWVGFDVLCGVGLAAGGFTISGIVYIFRLDAYRPIARPAVLTAFIGYLMVIGGLVFDLGYPWRIWHPLIMWNPRSVMFEVAWCVTLYTTVLALEVSTFVFERIHWPRATRVAHMATLPLTFAAVLLSMLHQSSLGSLFLIVPERLHAFWYSPLLPVHFLVSAVAAGLAMTIIESHLTARSMGRCVESALLARVSRMTSIVLGIYLLLRFVDLIQSGALTWERPPLKPLVFLGIELVIGGVLPLAMLLQEKVRHNARLTYRAAQVVVLGFIIHRLNVSITGFELVSGKTYIPAWTELAVTGSLLTIGVTVFSLAARYLPLFEPASETVVSSGPERVKSRPMARILQPS